MFVSRLAAGGLLLLALLALSLDGKPVQEETQSLQRPRLPRSPLEEEEQLSSERSPQTLSLGGKPDLRPCYPPCHHRPRPKPRVVVQQLSSPHESPAGGTMALREELTPGPEAASGPAAAKAPAAPLRRAKGKGASASARPMRDLRADGKQARQNWGRMVQPDHHAVGGGGGARRLKGLAKKAGGKGCFGLKLDRIGSTSGLGC
nr:Waglerin peptide 2 [Tropidolaemus subannulatus]